MPFFYRGDNPPVREDRLADLLVCCPPVVGVDTETVTLMDRTCIGIGIATAAREGYYFPFPETNPDFQYIQAVLEDPAILKVFHNSFYDLDVLDLLGLKVNNLADTRVMAHLVNMDLTKLEWLAPIVNRETKDAGEMLKAAGYTEMTQLDPMVVANKCLDDCQATLMLWQKWYGEMDNYMQEYSLTEMKVIPILHKMSLRGIAIDHEVRKRLLEETSREVDFYRSLAEAEGFNPGSPQQVGHILAKRGNMLKVRRNRDTGRMSIPTPEEVLETLDDPMATLVLNYRKKSKFKNTYLEPLAGEPRCYTHFHLDARTGRVSSGGSKEASNIRNLQNIPPPARCMFIPDNGCFTDADYSQVELRVLAHMSQDPVMMEIFERDQDIHQETADYMGVKRNPTAKSTNFAMVYGATALTVMQTAKIRDYKRAVELVKMWASKFHVAWDFITSVQEEALRTGYTTTLYGRRIKLPLAEETEDKIKRKGINYPVQGGAAEIVKRAMIKCADAGLLDTLTLQVHDDLLWDGDVFESVLGLGLDNIAEFRTPLKIKLIERWE